MTPTKLSKLLVDEVSGVDDPANELRGWLVAKSRGWNVESAEARVRKHTGAEEAPNAEYAECFLFNTGEGEELPSDFGAYKFLIADVENDDLVISLDAIRAAKATYPDSSLSQEDKDAMGQLIDRLEARLTEEQESRKNTTSIVGKIKALLTGKEDIDMTKEELQAELDERFVALGDALAERLSKSVETPAPEGEELPTAEEPTVVEGEAQETAVAAITSEDVAKAVTEALETVIEAVSKTLDRLSAVEDRLAIRKSLDGQEAAGEGDEPATPTISDAITAAFKGRAVTLS